jgi:hypothetical protein
MCQALCPGAETAAYTIPRGADADIAQAVSLRGRPYTKLAGAFKYQKSFDPSCSCRKPGQSWAEALQKAEKMIERGPGDIIVTAKKAEELSRPKLVRKPATPTQAQIAAKILDVETTGSITSKPADGAGAAVAKAGLDSPGAENPADSQAKRSIRMVGPTFISLPQQAAAE